MNSVQHEPYEINLREMQICNDESHGWKAITGTHTINGHHVQYVNDDGRTWAVAVHVSHFLFVESQLRQARIREEFAPVEAADVSMAVVL